MVPNGLLKFSLCCSTIRQSAVAITKLALVKGSLSYCQHIPSPLPLWLFHSWDYFASTQPKTEASWHALGFSVPPEVVLSGRHREAEFHTHAHPHGSCTCYVFPRDHIVSPLSPFKSFVTMQAPVYIFTLGHYFFYTQLIIKCSSQSSTYWEDFPSTMQWCTPEWTCTAAAVLIGSHQHSNLTHPWMRPKFCPLPLSSSRKRPQGLR